MNAPDAATVKFISDILDILDACGAVPIWERTRLSGTAPKPRTQPR